MNHVELRQELKQVKDYTEILKQNIEQLEAENNMSGITKTQKDCNIELLGLWRNEIPVMEKRERYLLNCLDKPEQEKKEEMNLYDAITVSPFNVRCALNGIMSTN
ncbi:TPA: hypothetical protein QCW56_005066 [Bacillus cereus]|uniref:hypothetical protein n=1 Tax=Bacillus cereus group sp. BcHK10 TaxID=3018096 RepID=UPI0022E0E0CC|nr:hypothetical protein [Bacillus cereus group sp. BcHK10]MDA1963679.1 hypothetical protein [Bacillus cereus group sp. BcHK10]HDR7206431.1 hypothetical protein [Bacillus cereus]HDR8049097.1 hypothetical protein [Bacillus cereus]